MNAKNDSAFLVFVIIAIIIAAFLLSVAMASLPSLGMKTEENPSPGIKTDENWNSQQITHEGSGDNSTNTFGNSAGNKTASEPCKSNCCLNCRSKPSGNLLVLEIYGKPQTSYLRTTATTQYDDGQWTIGPDDQVTTYNGSYISQDRNFYTSKNQASISIEVANDWTGFVPTIYNTNQLHMKNIALDYFPSQQIFYTSDTFMGCYTVDYTLFEFSDSLLANSPIAPQDSSQAYLQIPEQLKSLVQPILNEIGIDQIGNNYQKINTIKNYLQTNYQYDLDFTPAPPDQDPVLWFLFTEKRGVCVNFNSAFVVLMRAAGIPSRIVSGYGINPNLDYQQVTSMQGHAWAEVKFDQLGWVEFDATGSGQCDCSLADLIPTTTTITFLSESANKGGTFTVRGDVTAANGAVPNGLEVSVAILEDKNGVGLVCGKTTVTNGHFSLDSMVPTKIDVGDYNIVAKTLSGNGFAGSKSDPILKVNSETALNSRALQPIYVNKPVSLETQLTEKAAQTPIENAQLTLTYPAGSELKTVTQTTNKSGYATFTLDPSAPGAVINYTLSFNGASYYLPSALQGSIEMPNVEASPSENENQSSTDNNNNQIIFYASIPVASVAVLGAVVTVRKRKKAVSSGKTAVQTHISSPIPTVGDNELEIAFPQIKPPFPNVWGINENLVINVFLHTKKSSQGTLTLSVEGLALNSLKIDNTKPVSFSLPNLQKGTHTIVAEYNDSHNENFKAEREIRIVDYTEEIVAIYKDTFQQQKANGSPLGEENTPREFQRITQASSNSIDTQALEELVSLFEIADYSLLSLKREHYESMFLAALKIKSSTEKTDGE
jgi:hypothetical protein